MRISITIVEMGGGYLRAVFGQSRNLVTGEWCPDSVFGANEQELLDRLKTRFPGIKAQLRKEGHRLGGPQN
jgi:hypothetical protein